MEEDDHNSDGNSGWERANQKTGQASIKLICRNGEVAAMREMYQLLI